MRTTRRQTTGSSLLLWLVLSCFSLLCSQDDATWVQAEDDQYYLSIQLDNEPPLQLSFPQLTLHDTSARFLITYTPPRLSRPSFAQPTARAPPKRSLLS